MLNEDRPDVRPSPKLSTADRILEGALRAFGRRGVAGLSMREISEEAGVSRGTIYRYYPTREDLLSAAAHYDQRRFDIGANAVLRSAPAGPAQLRALLHYMHRFQIEHPSRWMVASDPAFLIDYLSEQVPEMVATLSDVLRPTLEASAIIRSGQSTVQLMAELIVRWMVSVYLLPADRWEAEIETIAILITAGGDYGPRPI